MDVPHKLSLIAMLVMFAPNGGRPCEGNKEPVMNEVQYQINSFLLAINYVGAVRVRGRM
jgi:hypothetical protein